MRRGLLGRRPWNRRSSRTAYFGTRVGSPVYGAVRRVHIRKSEVSIFDYVEREVPMLRRMFESRLRGYRAIGEPTDDEATPRTGGCSARQGPA